MADCEVQLWTSPISPNATVEVLQSRRHLLSTLLDYSTSTTETIGTKLLIFFPGNPGMVEFYRDFCGELVQEGFDVLVMGFAGHSLTADHNHGRLFSLQEQIDTAAAFCTAILTPSTTCGAYPESVYVGGHSVGGFVGLQMLARFSCFQRYFGLCPVISRIGESPNGKGMFFWGTPVLQWAVTYMGSLIVSLPTAVKRALVRRDSPHLNSSLQEAIATKLHRPAIMNIFFLSMDEYRMLQQPDAMLLQHHQKKLVMYYVKKDGWAPPNFSEEIRDTCTDLRAYIMEEDASVKHAWCISHNGIVVRNAILPYLAN